jgi:3-(3-hydroxy-phenyl)propionate hydroxylase
MKGDFPAERWFQFEPSFHAGGSVLLHKQADDIWRIDFQLGWASDPEEEKKPERVVPRIRAMLGDARPFELHWASVYTFQCARLERFMHGRVIFAGDAAHQVSPFGARGANSGIQDADNLCWKLTRVLRRQSPQTLLESYNEERVEAADENILNSSRSTDFITPKCMISRQLRDAVLALSQRHPFARRLVNSGRLSTPTGHRSSTLSTPDRDAFDCALAVGAPAADAPVRARDGATSLLDQLGGRFDLITFAEITNRADAFEAIGSDLRVTRLAAAGRRVIGTLDDSEGLAMRRYGTEAGGAYLLRPDQHVAARWRSPSVADVFSALTRAQGCA